MVIVLLISLAGRTDGRADGPLIRHGLGSVACGDIAGQKGGVMLPKQAWLHKVPTKCRIIHQFSAEKS